MENLNYIIIALITGILLISIYLFIKSKYGKKDVSRTVNFTGTGGVNYTAKLIPGRTGKRAKDWRYYKNNPGGDDIEILDIILYMLLWDIFMGEDGEYMVDDRFHQESFEEVVETVYEEPEIAIDEPTKTDVIEYESVVETNPIEEEESRRSYEDSYTSTDSYSSNDSYDSGGSDD